MKIQENREERHQQKAVESCAPQTHTHERDHALNEGHSHQKEGTQSQKDSGKVKRHPFVEQHSILWFFRILNRKPLLD